MAYQVNFCETKEQLKHLGEVVTGKTEGSPTGADIDTSTLQYTGQTRKTLTALEAEYQEAIDNAQIENYAGLWPDTGGSANKGETWQTQTSGTPTGQYFRALQNTSVAPVNDNENWREVVNTESVTTAQNDIVGGSIFKGSNGDTVRVGDEIQGLGTPYTHLMLDVNGSGDIFRLASPIELNLNVLSLNYDENRGIYEISTDGGLFVARPISDDYANHSSISDPILQRITNATDVFYNQGYPNSSYIGDFTFLLPTTYGVGESIFISRLPDKRFSFELNKSYFLGTNETAVWVSRYGAIGASGSFFNPLSAQEFAGKVNSGDYNNLGSVLHVYLTDDVYYRDDMPANFGVITGTRFIIDGSNAPSGRSMITPSYELSWSQTAPNLYNATLPASELAARVINIKEKDELGLPIVYKPVASSAEREPGSFWMDGNVLHVQTTSNASGAIDGVLAAPSGHYRGDMKDISVNCIMENIDIFGRGHRCTPTTKDITVVYDKCHFITGSDDAWYVDKPEYRIIHNECIAKGSGKDGFNYHNYNAIASDDGTAIEINCKAYDAGKYKYIDGNQTTNSNNATTAHDGSTIFRFGGEYWDCEGSTVADVGGCKTVNYGVKAWRPVDSTDPNYIRAFWLTKGSGATQISQFTAVTVDCEALGYKEGDDELFYQTNDNWYFDNVKVSGQSMYLDANNAKRIR